MKPNYFYLAYDFSGTEKTGYWWSKTAHCTGCLSEKELGYGDDIEGCCCKHAHYSSDEGDKSVLFETREEAEKYAEKNGIKGITNW